MKAVIVDFRDGHAAALRDDGCVIRIRDAGYTLGQVIELHERVRPRWRRTVFSLAAAAALLLGIGGAAYAMPYGVVTLDADSSIQYTINMFDYVLDVQAADEEGEALLEELDIRHVRHHRVDSAIATTMERIESRGYPDESAFAISVSADTKNERHTQRLCQELERTVNEHMPIPAPESGNQSGVRDMTAEPPYPEAKLTDIPESQPVGERAPAGRQDGEEQRPAGEGDTPREPHTGQFPTENGAPTADTQEEGNSPDMQGGQDKETRTGYAAPEQSYGAPEGFGAAGFAQPDAGHEMRHGR